MEAQKASPAHPAGSRFDARLYPRPFGLSGIDRPGLGL